MEKTDCNLQDKGKYDDMIHLPHHVSEKYPQMPVQDRAAQFAPFVALTGHEEVIKETEKQHISDDMESVEYV